MAVTCRIILCILLTCIVQYITLFVFKEFDLDHSVFAHSVIVIIAFILFFWAWEQYGKISASFVRASMVKRPDSFDLGKIDCYVRFLGKIKAENRVALPFSNRECSFYAASIIAEWETKKKKPARGMETQLKPLLRDHSADEFELVGKAGQVYIKASDFSKSWLQLRKKEKTTKNCPQQPGVQDQVKYKKYHLQENFCLEGDTVTAQGKLSLEAGGRLFIRPTGRLRYPSFVAVKQRQNGSDQFIRAVAQQAVKDARLKQINTGALVLNALLLLLSVYVSKSIDVLNLF